MTEIKPRQSRGSRDAAEIQLLGTRQAIQTCAMFGMHCNCGDALYNVTGKGMAHGESCSKDPGCSGKCAAP